LILCHILVDFEVFFINEIATGSSQPVAWNSPIYYSTSEQLAAALIGL